jgi:diguanylate cyclase (GGDEF)-like protein
VIDRQTRDGQPVALLAFDLDRFKQINDTLGHAMGDQVLCIFAGVLQATMRPGDLVARIGGEEFVAMTAGPDHQAVVAIANRIREGFQKAALYVDGERIGATVSVGIAARDGGPCDLLGMLAEADAALYRAKNDGRNCVMLATPQPVGFSPSGVVRIA